MIPASASAEGDGVADAPPETSERRHDKVDAFRQKSGVN
jgi:hypothetical protein